MLLQVNYLLCKGSLTELFDRGNLLNSSIPNTSASFLDLIFQLMSKNILPYE